MDVVQDVVRVLELELARRHHAHVRDELAAVLIDGRLHRLRTAALGARDGDDGVREPLVGADHDLLDHRLGPALLGVLVHLELLDHRRAGVRHRGLDGPAALRSGRARTVGDDGDARDERDRQKRSDYFAHCSGSL